MKKIMLVLIVCAINLGAYAQSSYGAGSSNSDSIGSSGLNVPDGYVKKNGKTVMVKDGKFTTLKKDITLSDGTVVKTNGSYKTSDGIKTELKEGDHLDLNGKLTTLDNSKNNNINSNNNNNQINGQSSDGSTPSSTGSDKQMKNNTNDNNNQVK